MWGHRARSFEHFGPAFEYRDALKTPVGLLPILSETGGEARGPRRGGSSGVLTVGSWEDGTEDYLPISWGNGVRPAVSVLVLCLASPLLLLCLGG